MGTLSKMMGNFKILAKALATPLLVFSELTWKERLEAKETGKWQQKDRKNMGRKGGKKERHIYLRT